jgi:beta-lactamase class A
VTTAPAHAPLAVEEAVGAFVRGAGSRRVLVESLRGPEVAVAVGPDEPMPAASLLKLPLAAAACTQLPLDRVVTRAEIRASRYPSVLAAFDGAHQFTLRELCRLALVTSDNAAADFLLGLVGPDAVNALIADWGCAATRLTTGYSDDCLENGARTNVTSARDAATMIRRAATDPGVTDLATALANNLRGSRIPLRLTEETRTLNKTGTLEGVCNDAAVVLGAGSDLVAAFLCDAQPDVAATSIELGDCFAAIWGALGEPVTV